jgi:hypothetical protein
MPVKSLIKALHSIAMEAIVFTSGVRLAEVDSSAAISLAGECLKLVSDAIAQLQLMNMTEKDEYVEEALRELENSKELFKSVITGERSTQTIKRCISYGLENRNIFILDLAHSHVHKAIDFLKKSKNCNLYRDVLELLTTARRESAPTTLYRLAYEMRKKGGV